MLYLLYPVDVLHIYIYILVSSEVSHVFFPLIPLKNLGETGQDARRAHEKVRGGRSPGTGQRAQAPHEGLPATMAPRGAGESSEKMGSSQGKMRKRGDVTGKNWRYGI